MSIEFEHAQMVKKLAKNPASIGSNLMSEHIDVWHAVTGIVTEAGELMDAVKKWVVYNKPLDVVNMEEELGDLEFYMEQLRQRMEFTRDQTLVANMKKLSTRYPEFKYSDQSAQARADKTDNKP